MGRFLNSFGETPKEQEKRREWLRGVYDRATTDEQTIFQENNNNSLAQNNLNNYNSPYQPMVNDVNSNTLNNKPQSPLSQIGGAIQDMSRNYFDMKKDNTVGADDYFHCKANFEATQRGPYGETIAQNFGDAKERFDYFSNRLFKGVNFPNAYSDYFHDKDVNMQGRHQAKTGLYSNSRAGCNYFRVPGINDKY